MEYSLTRNTQRQRGRDVFLINFHSCSIQYRDRQVDLQHAWYLALPPQPTPVCPYLDLRAHKHSHKWYQRWLKPFGLGEPAGGTASTPVQQGRH